MIEIFHSSPFGGHGGVKRTVRKIAARYYWKTLLPDITHFVQTCETCQRCKVDRTKAQEPVGVITAPSAPWELISMDFAGPLAKVEDFAYILVIVDHFTQFCVTVPLMSIDARTTARALIDEVICKHGMPMRILTDLGSAFNSKVMTQLAQYLKVKMKFSSSHHPQANGKVERLVGTLKSVLKTTADTYQEHWVDALQPATFAYNATPNEVTGYSPYYLNYGRHPTYPADILSKIRPIEGLADKEVDSYAWNLASNLHEAYNFVTLIMESRQQDILAQNEKLVKIPIYNVGDEVWLNVAILPKMSIVNKELGARPRTLPRPFTGPYKVQQRVGRATYVIQAIVHGVAKGVRHTVHASRLRPCRPETEVEATTFPSGIIEEEQGIPDVDMEDSPMEIEPTPPASMPEPPMALHTRTKSPATVTFAPRDTTGALVRDSEGMTIAERVRKEHEDKLRPNYAENITTLTPRPASRYSLPPRTV